MTGYAYRELQEKEYTLSVEIRSYNSRFLEIYINLPPYLSPLEQGIRELVAGTCTRGKIELMLRYRELDAPLKVTVNREAAAAYKDAINTLAETLHINEQPDLKTIIGQEGVLEIERIRDEGRYWERIAPLVKTVLLSFDTERVREGQHTQAHVLSQILLIENSLTQITAYAP
ncbi:MAG: YicC family protein, partial [Treponema sp.]|nr:YicC family protein [Treponema sp.]